jgi:hypothetical protein
MSYIRPDDVVFSALRASDSGMRDADNAEIHEVAIKTIRRWRRDYQRRGKPRGRRGIGTPCPRCDGAALDRSGYAELLGWYLGDGHITAASRGRFDLHIFDDAKYSCDIERIRSVMARVKPGSRGHLRSVPGCTIVTVGWKHWPCLFPQHGPGRKHKRFIRLEPWQQAIVDECPGDLLRGLFHSDGCRITNVGPKS